MSDDVQLLQSIADLLGAQGAERGERIQSLWSGYGEIVRVRLRGSPAPTVIVKHVEPPSAHRHPRGWASDRSHERKLRSYAVEHAFYRDVAPRCDDTCRVPRLLGSVERPGRWVFVLEDLDAAGFSRRLDDLARPVLDRALGWLASFHARFLGTSPEGLWPTGTYWHLATRPDELAATRDPALAEAAHALDAALEASPFKTLVHGDAKVANLCFTPDLTGVAAVDFQYVGGGCGMKDVAYLFSSCLSGPECARLESELLEVYFAALRGRLDPAVDADALERDWRRLYPMAWADFARFLSGWAPEHWKLHGYAAAKTREALALL